MNNESKDAYFWNVWRDILLTEYDGRLAALGTKGYRVGSARKTFAAIFLQVKGFLVPAVDILPEAIRAVQEKDSLHSLKEYDDIAIMGHRIGMVENSAGLKQYLQDIRPFLKPAGQIILTAVDVPAINEKENRSSPAHNSLQFQQASLIGPFFVLICIKANTLKSAASANWQCDLVYRQDENNYFARLSLS